jgi:putative N-acetyltransferase (TIGR04045 family)
METIFSSALAASGSLCRPAAGEAELAAHYDVRRRVFVATQGLFECSDRDDRDETADTVHVVGVVDGEIVGAVRLYPLDRHGRWKGDRLAVLPEARVRHLGAQLVQFAVATAGELGGHRMVAQVQVPNVRFFEQLDWSTDGPPGLYHGVMHQPMAIPLYRVPGL